MSEELKPCPFCGGTDLVHFNNVTGDYGGHEIECNNCKVSPCNAHETYNEAVEQWNTRADHIPDASKMMWISVDKALPSRHSVCIVHIDYGDGGAYEVDVFARNWVYNWDKNITHWMLLPEIPNA